MTKDETRQILSILRIAYPQTYAKWTKAQREEYLSLWSKALQEDDALDVMVAVWHYIYETDREFAPTVGMIRSYIGTTPHYVLEDMAIKFFPEDRRVQYTDCYLELVRDDGQIDKRTHCKGGKHADKHGEVRDTDRRDCGSQK